MEIQLTRGNHESKGSQPVGTLDIVTKRTNPESRMGPTDKSKAIMVNSSTGTATMYRAVGSRLDGKTNDGFSSVEFYPDNVSYKVVIRPMSELPVMKRVSFGGAFCSSDLLYDGPGGQMSIGWVGPGPQRVEDAMSLRAEPMMMRGDPAFAQSKLGESKPVPLAGENGPYTMNIKCMGQANMNGWAEVK